MTCEDVRVALSARLDGEKLPISAKAVEVHLAGCSGCRVWLIQAERVTRVVRVQPVDVPDLTARVLAAVTADASATTSTGDRDAVHVRRQVLRLAVAVTAIAQLAVALPVLLAAFGVGGHTGREMASFDVAIAVGYALAAYRPERARAFIPVAVVLAACLAATSAIDIANSTTGWTSEIGHLAAVVQAGLLWALWRVDSAQNHPLSSIVAAGRG